MVSNDYHLIGVNHLIVCDIVLMIQIHLAILTKRYITGKGTFYPTITPLNVTFVTEIAL